MLKPRSPGEERRLRSQQRAARRAGNLTRTLPTISDVLKSVAPLAADSVSQVSCGCCTNGCTCFMHRDVPRGVRQQKCALHSGTGKIEVVP